MAERTETANERPAYPIGSVDSALRLLQIVADQPWVRIAEASKELGVARSTAHRLMQMLQYHGFVRQDADSKAYAAGPVLIGLGLQVVRKMDVRTIARPHMEALSEETGETVHLMALQPGAEVLCLDSVESEKALRVGGRTGIILAAHASASGRALLSTLPQEELVALYPSSRLPKRQPKTITQRSALFRELEAIRERGYALQRDESENDVSAVSAPIRLDDHSASFVLTIAVPTSRLTDKNVPRFGRAVMHEAREIAGELPY